MKPIHIKAFGLATGLTAALLYFSCIILMKLAGPDNTRIFFNSLLHGIDSGPILRMNISATESALGILETFMIAWLVGASIAAFYNIASHARREIY